MKKLDDIQSGEADKCKVLAEPAKKEKYPHRISFMREVFESHFRPNYNDRNILVFAYGRLHYGDGLREYEEIRPGEDWLIHLLTPDIFLDKTHIMNLLY